LGQAARIDGVTPADVALLQIALHKESVQAEQEIHSGEDNGGN
jgi:hypothetical protein